MMEDRYVLLAIQYMIIVLQGAAVGRGIESSPVLCDMRV
jgi:hypothetical protein